MKNILFVGDIIIGDGPVSIGCGMDSLHKQTGYGHIFDGVKAYLKSFSYVIGNFEGVIKERPLDEDIENWTMCCDERICQQLINSNVNVVSLANNHTMDYGIEVFENTRRHLQDSGIRVIGLREKPYEVLEIGEVPVAVVGVSYVNNNQKVSPGFFYNPTDHEWNKVMQELVHIENKIAYVHWGNEFVSKPVRKQVLIAQNLINHGFNVIIGHHPHILQENVCLESKLVCFSLGNFVSYYKQKRLRKTMAVEINLFDLFSIHEIYCKIDHAGCPWVIKERTRKVSEFDHRTSSNTKISIERLRMRSEYLITFIKNFPQLKGKKKIFTWLLKRLFYVMRFFYQEIKNPDILYDNYKK